MVLSPSFCRYGIPARKRTCLNPVFEILKSTVWIYKMRDLIFSNFPPIFKTTLCPSRRCFPSIFKGSFYISFGEADIISINWGDFD